MMVFNTPIKFYFISSSIMKDIFHSLSGLLLRGECKISLMELSNIFRRLGSVISRSRRE
jgi:hypothetical protein